MAAKQTKSRSKADKRSTEDKLVDAALDLAAGKRWRDISLADIADAAGVPLGDALLEMPGRLQILKAIGRRIDTAVLQSLAKDPLDGAIKDKLFDLLMRRFDSLEGRQAAMASITADIMRDPVTALCLSNDLRRSMARMLEAAGVGTGGLQGALRVKGLGAIYLDAARVWVKDEDPGLASTMARLDKDLARAERIEGTCAGFRNRKTASDTPSHADAP